MTSVPTDQMFGDYRLTSVLGTGGMGQVWRAFDTTHRREVALKLLPPHLSKDAVFRRRFLHEAEVVAGLRDPHVVPIHAYGSIEEHLYIDMALIDGRDLGSILATGPMSPEKAVDVITQAADALDAAHHAGLVHRDVKPSNLIVTDRRGFVYLIDFGIAHGDGDTRQTATNGLIGTSEYMAPERYSGAADPSVDVYALACVLFHCLVGRPPFGSGSAEQQMRSHLTTLPPLASRENDAVPTSLDEVIGKGMAKNPAERYASAGELASAARTAIAAAEITDGGRSAIPGSTEAPSGVADRVSARLRDATGSWIFGIALVAFLALWCGYNLTAGAGSGFDPYPFILLSLVLSALAAAQCWLLLWTARRAAKDRAQLLRIVGKVLRDTSQLAYESREMGARIESLARDVTGPRTLIAPSEPR